MLAAGVGWPDVVLALIAAVPGIIAAIYAGKVNRQVKTPSKTPLGEQVENVLHTSLANHYRIRKIGGAVGADTSPAAGSEAAKVPDLPEGDGEPQ